MARPMPGILKLLMIMCALTGALTGLACVAFLVAATVGSGPYFVQGAAVTREEFMGFAVPTLIGQVVLSIFAIGAAVGLYRRRYWARPLLLGLTLATFLFSLLAGTVLGLPWGQVTVALITGGVGTLFFWWVLYRRDDVVDWFESLREPQSESQ